MLKVMNVQLGENSIRQFKCKRGNVVKVIDIFGKIGEGMEGNYGLLLVYDNIYYIYI